ncbi:MAG: hypothetical protein LUD78_10930 [Clostridiales bacterium]|nr:hypothetical protein [Clostridiales bacterium]
MTTAKWKTGWATLHHNADAQKVADEILSIGENVSPEEIVEKAKDEATELHKCFTWDDTEAAQKWRVHEARQIVCHLVVENDKPQAVETRAFYRAEGNGYKPTSLIIRREDEYTALVNRAMQDLQAFRRRYESITELEPVFEAIDSLGA